jgi:hypothetical protein
MRKEDKEEKELTEDILIYWVDEAWNGFKINIEFVMSLGSLDMYLEKELITQQLQC